MYSGVLRGAEVMYSGVLCCRGHVQRCVVLQRSCTVVCCVAEVMYSGVLRGIQVMYSGVLYVAEVMYSGVLCGAKVMYSGVLCSIGVMCVLGMLARSHDLCQHTQHTHDAITTHKCLTSPNLGRYMVSTKTQRMLLKQTPSPDFQHQRFTCF